MRDHGLGLHRWHLLRSNRRSRDNALLLREICRRIGGRTAYRPLRLRLHRLRLRLHRLRLHRLRLRYDDWLRRRPLYNRSNGWGLALPRSWAALSLLDRTA